ncbi:MAG: PQQ-dependent sugar dehydrogenase [Chloroflexi bacterium]|nr:PQQ-dependent sugar dehydrogenase [Chloroflexota bacterium]
MPRSGRRSAALLSALMLLTTLAMPAAAAPVEPAQAAADASAALSGGQIRLTKVDDGFVNPLGVVNAGDGTSRLFVVEKRGTVRVVSGNQLQSGSFLDLRGVAGGLTTDGERGLLGLAFHPDFASNRKLFVYYTNGGGDLVIAQMQANPDRTLVPVASHDELLVIEHSDERNHNGGQLLFGPDGYLYIFTGDGGGSGDPGENAQNINSLLGKTLRIAPNLSGGYTNPAGNPYRGATAGADQIWSIGLRNPWRASFDRANGNLWIADVGQGKYEEINREPANTPGRNYGWDCREGKHAYSDPSPGISCSGLTLTDPIAEYGHGNGDCSVTGGYVYRGPVFRELVGHYVFGDFCSGRIWTLDAGAASPGMLFHRDTSAMITAFGEAENRELYMVDYAAGVLYRVVAPQFSDVTDSKFINDITWLGYEGLTSGCGGDRFCPKGAVARDQMASFLARALRLPAALRDHFSDDNGNKHEENINRIADAGITFGCGGGRYCPSGLVPRDQMASFLARALDLPPATRDHFTDDTGNRHENNINRFAEAGITHGCSATTFCPKGLTVREQMAAFLHRAFRNR